MELQIFSERHFLSALRKVYEVQSICCMSILNTLVIVSVVDNFCGDGGSMCLRFLTHYADLMAILQFYLTIGTTMVK